MARSYHGALRSTLTKKGDIAVIFTPEQAQKYLEAQSSAGAQVRVDVAIAQAIEAILPKKEGGADER